MLPEQHQTIISCLQAAVASILPEARPVILLERPKVAAHGDIATNVAMQLAKPAKRNPRELAQAIVDALMANPLAVARVAETVAAGGALGVNAAVLVRAPVIAPVVAAERVRGVPAVVRAEVRRLA